MRKEVRRESSTYACTIVRDDLDMSAHVGKPHDFAPDDMQLLREAALELKERHRWSDKKLGGAIGITQQNANRFVKSVAPGGISRTTANLLASALGFRDAEELLVERRILKGLKAAKKINQWHARDSAMRMAEAIGYARDAIDAVVERSSDAEFAKEDVKWWMSEFVMEEARQAVAAARRQRRAR